MCDAEIDWHERAFRQNCSRSGFVNDGIFELLFSDNFNLYKRPGFASTFVDVWSPKYLKFAVGNCDLQE